VTKAIVFYHAECSDGMGAAWAMHQALGKDAEYIACHYKGPETLVSVFDKDVYFVDFSVPRADLMHLCKSAKSVTVDDHHKSAKDDLDNSSGWAPANCTINFDMGKAGCRLAWERAKKLGVTSGWMTTAHSSLRSATDLPVMLQYIEDRDLWRWNLPDSKQINAWIQMQPYAIQAYEALALNMEHPAGFAAVLAAGGAIYAYNATVCEKQARQLVRRTWEGHRVLYGNVAHLVSETASRALEMFDDVDLTLTYFDLAARQEGPGKRIHSMRARSGGVDVSAIAKRHGGGGHPAAAGFEHTVYENVLDFT